MNEGRKISIRKIMQTAVTVIVTVGCVTAILSASRLQRAKTIQGYHINIKNNQYKFVDKDEVKAILASSGNADIASTKLRQLDAQRIEKMVLANAWVEEAQVYVDNNRKVHININQRVPVARLFDQAGNSYYLDQTMKALPLSDRYIHYTTVVTNVPVLKDDSIDNNLKAQIVAVVKQIERDEFWKAQVSQVIVNNNRNFELVPVLGNQKILIGDSSRLDEKFDNLYSFYKKILNRIGWDKYQVLDVSFAAQVVAYPALPWSPAAKNALSNMSWVKSIIGADTNARRISDTMQFNTVSKTVIIKPEDKRADLKRLPPQKTTVAKKAAVASATAPKKKDKKIDKKIQVTQAQKNTKENKEDKKKQEAKYIYH